MEEGTAKNVLEKKVYQLGGFWKIWKPLTQATLPGTDQACFQTAEIDRTPTTCANGHVPLWEYECRSLPIEAKSPRVRGHDTVTGKDARDSTTSKVDSGKRMATKTRGRCVLTKNSEELARDRLLSLGT